MCMIFHVIRQHDYAVCIQLLALAIRALNIHSDAVPCKAEEPLTVPALYFIFYLVRH